MNRNNSITVIAIIVAVFGVAFALFHQRPESPEIANIPNTVKDLARNSQTGTQQPVTSNTVHPGPLEVEYASPAPQIAPMQPEATPASAKAQIAVEDKFLSPPNHGGHFERIAVVANQPVNIALSWLDDQMGEGVFVHAIQGGTIDGEQAKSFDFRKERAIRFSFKPGTEPGLYQVLLRRGTTEEVLEFWVPTNRPEKDPHALN